MPVFSQPYYTISATLLLKQYNHGHPVIRNNRLNIYFSMESEFTPYLYTILCSLRGGYIFSVADSLIRDSQCVSELLPKLYLITAINSSSKGRTIIPFFFGAADTGFLDIMTIRSYFEKQGMPDIEFPFFCTDQKMNKQNSNGCCLLILPPNPANFTTIFRDITENAITIISLSNPIVDLAAIEDILPLVNLSKESGQLDVSFNEVTASYVDREEFETERNLWQKRTLLYLDFLRLSKTVQQKEYYDLIDWYHKEYEILPLWYKRFGHILKVIKGKRTFRSLFHDNVKKYKD